VLSTDLGPLFASYPAWRRTGCLALIWAPCLLAIRPGAVPGAWHRFRPLFASIPPGAAPGA